MDWGNAVIDVRPFQAYHMQIFGLSMIASAHSHILEPHASSLSHHEGRVAVVSALTVPFLDICQLDARCLYEYTSKYRCWLLRHLSCR